MAKAQTQYGGLLLLVVGGLVVHRLVAKKWLWEAISAKRTALNAGRYLNMKRLSAPRPVTQPRQATQPRSHGITESTRTVYVAPDPTMETVMIIDR